MGAQTALQSDERVTQADFRRWLKGLAPADLNHYELIQGRIVMSPPGGWPHGGIGATLSHLLNVLLFDRDAGLVLDSSIGYELPSGDTVEPDVSFITEERLTAGPPPKPGQFLRIVPNLVIEILSRSTSRRDRTDKKEIYERNGVDEYWIVDPRRKVVTVFHLGDQGYEAGRTFDNGTVRSRLLPKLRVPIGTLFSL